MSMLLLILGMAAATATPRVLPLLMPDRIRLPEWVERWMASVPYAALGALIFPGVLSAGRGDGTAPLIAAGAAALVALLRQHVVFSIAAAVAVMFLLQ